ncbi:Scarecrow-like protein 3 [Hibiscus syriacus]|uniref:Scarecrow-like protein 3 n=1 Tax=Hibiscus syriacus TaxID=106335 RepID=A0A6A2YXK5_HIBSY|nr:Scarecrow-like protein 3 [Hibiscus syriacus]
MEETFETNQRPNSKKKPREKGEQILSLLPPPVDIEMSELRILKCEERGLYLIHLLLTCANHVANGSLENANIALKQISRLASPDGDFMQRMAAYFMQALADRILKAWPGLHMALNSTRIALVSEEIIVRKLFFQLFPFLKVAFVRTNQAVNEAMEGEKMVHIIYLNAVEPAPWVALALIQALSARPEGPPHLRITGIHQQKQVLDQMAHRLTEEAEKLDLPFQFNPVLLEKDTINGYSPSPDSASSSPAPLSSTGSVKVDSFQNALWGLSPKLMVVTEQDSNHNGSTLMEILLESLYSYAALFDCSESTVSRTSPERLKVKKMLFGEEIKNIIACEGAERKERHEKLEKWIQRLDLAGLGNVPLSYYGMLHARRLLQGYNCDGYKIKEENGWVGICWQGRRLFSVSAWRCRK